MKRRRYRKYLTDSEAPIPKVTRWRHSMPTSSGECSSAYHEISDHSDHSSNPRINDEVASALSYDDLDTLNHTGSTSCISEADSVQNESPAESSHSSHSFSPFHYSSPCDDSSTSFSSWTFNSPTDEHPSFDFSSPDEATEQFVKSFSQRDSEMFNPLYNGSSVTLCGAVCAIMHFCTSSKLSFVAIEKLLKLLDVLCPSPNCLPKSVYQLKKIFKRYNVEYSLVEYCSECLNQLGDCSCNRDTKTTCHIVNVPIEKSLEVIISSKLCLSCQYYHWESLKRQKHSDDCSIHDIWDGTVLKPQLSEGRYFSNSCHLALSFTTDGVPIFKSSRVSLWPVYLMILNLPLPARMYAENIVLCGLYVGPSKPEMNLLFETIVKKIETLSLMGVPINTPDGLKTIRARLVMGTFDLPAKAAVLCAKQFNAEFGCSVCLHPGLRLENNARIYLPELYPERDHHGVVAAATLAEETHCAVDGVVGKSPFIHILDMVNSFPVDYMHAVLEGVTRMLLKYWFDSSYHMSPFYLGRHLATIDKELLSQRPPSDFSRAPRSIKKHLKYWKASELRTWLLFYSLPLLLNKLPPLYWHHYALLVCALHILLGSRIEVHQIDAAEKMIIDFYKLLPELYGQNSCTHNAHLLFHLPRFVRLWGPLWTHSTFDFEHKHGQLKHLFHGKNQIIKQLLFNIDVSITLQLLYPELLETEDDSVISFVTKNRHNMTYVSQHCYIVGKTKQEKLSSEQGRALNRSSARLFSRLFKSGTLYYATKYSRGCTGKRNNTICAYTDDNSDLRFGLIEVFSLDPYPVALLYSFQTSTNSLMQIAGNCCRASLEPYKEVDLLSSFIILPGGISKDLISVSIDKIIAKAVQVETQRENFLILQPNSYECH